MQKSLDGFEKHTELLRKELVSEEELNSAKIKLKQTIIGQSQDPLLETDLLAMNMLEPYGIKRIDKYYEAIDKITTDDIRKTAEFVFSRKRRTRQLHFDRQRQRLRRGNAV